MAQKRSIPRWGNRQSRSGRTGIKEEGLLEPIVLHEGEILDGRNRYRACALAEVEPRFVEWDGEGGSPVRFVVAKNIHRRHLTESQRAAAAGRIANLKHGQRADRVDRQICLSTSQADAAEMLNVSPRSVKTARKVLDECAPEVVEKVDAGELSLNAAAGIANLPKPEQAELAAKGKAAVLRQEPEICHDFVFGPVEARTPRGDVRRRRIQRTHFRSDMAPAGQWQARKQRAGSASASGSN